jgi:chromosome segregation ATPase
MPVLFAPLEDRNTKMEAATKMPQAPHATDRVLEALSTLAALLDRTINEVKGVEPDFQSRLLQAVHEAEETTQRQAAHRLETALTETRGKLEQQFSSRIAELTGRWEEERNRLHAELSKMSQNSAQWETERARLNGELERLARVQAATQAEAEKAVLAMRAASAAAKNAKTTSVDRDALNAEVQRVEVLIKEISELIENPTSELSTVIRKNVERAELESYIKGIRFALADHNSK